MRIAVLMHLYYQDLWSELALYVSNIPFRYDLFVNLAEKNPGNASLKKIIRRRFWSPFRKVIVQETENRGRDIGGFLRLVAAVLDTGRNYDAVILMHSKKTLHQDPKNGVNWRTSLLLSILGGRTRIRKIAGMFKTDPRLGMVGCKYWLFNEENRPDLLYCHNKPLIDEYCRRFDLKTEKNDFIAGTMFWVRAKPFLSFFAQHDPQALAAELEPGDLQDYHQPTRTHSWERIFGYMITSRGYTIGGVDIPLVMEPPPLWRRAKEKLQGKIFQFLYRVKAGFRLLAPRAGELIMRQRANTNPKR